MDEQGLVKNNEGKLCALVPVEEIEYLEKIRIILHKKLEGVRMLKYDKVEIIGEDGKKCDTYAPYVDANESESDDCLKYTHFERVTRELAIFTGKKRQTIQCN